MKKKISISMDENVLSEVDRLIDGIKIKNRSQAIEYIARNFMNSSSITKALILAGGSLKSLKYKNTYKPLFKINGKEIILNTIEKLKEINIKKIYIASGPITNEISKACQKITDVDISFISDNAQGTSGALYNFKPYVNDQFIVISGDVYFTFDLKQMIKFHKTRKDTIATVAVTTVDTKHSKDSIILEGTKIKNFEYKPKRPSFYSNAGVYIFNMEIFKYIRSSGSIERDIFPELAKKRKLSAYLTSGKWIHVD